MEQFRTGILTVTQPGADVKLELSVLGLMEEEQWCAIALEMSLRGYGSTFEAAFDQLRDAVKAQVTFTLEHGQLDQLIFPAEEHYISKYVEAKCAQARRVLVRYASAATVSGIVAAKTDMDNPFAAARKNFRMPKVANEVPPRFALS